MIPLLNQIGDIGLSTLCYDVIRVHIVSNDVYTCKCYVKNSKRVPGSRENKEFALITVTLLNIVILKACLLH